MKNIIFMPLLAVILLIGLAVESPAALFDVSPTLTTPAPGVPAGYPLWYQDFSDPAASPDANPSYGIGPTPGGLKLGFCPDVGVEPLCVSDAADDEFFYWTAGASMATPNGVAELVLATEAVDSLTSPNVFNRTRIRVDLPVAGTYTVTHPFGVNVFDVATPGIRAINDTLDEGCLLGTIGCDFRLALDSQVGSFLFWDTELPIASATPGGGFFVGDNATLHKVLGSPRGTNFFRVDGPAGSNLDGLGNDFIQTDQFIVSGKVFTGDGNTIPVAAGEAAATAAGTPVMLDVLANDTFTDIPINPGSVTIAGAPTGGTAVPVTDNGKFKVRYTPNAGFTGGDSFTYTVRNFAGMAGLDESVPATVSVLVEDLVINRAELRAKQLKWLVKGTSSDTTANTIMLLTEPLALNSLLEGSQEVPAVASAGSGSATVTPSDDLKSLTFTLSTIGLLNTTAAHIHVGEPGVDGPIIFNLILTPNFSSATGTLTAFDLVPQPAQGITTFDDAIRALLSGRTYVNVHTAANPGGEIRGQLGPVRLVGGATVQPDGSWSLTGKSTAVPPAAGTIRAISSNGVTAPAVPLQRR